MKECPVCNAVTFDDMETCYECLHRFSDEVDKEQKPYEQMKEALDSSRLLKQGIKEECATQGKSQDRASQSSDEKEKKEREQQPRLSSSDVKPWPTEAIIRADSAAKSDKKESKTWALKLSIPAHCKEVTLCLERTETNEAQESPKTLEPRAAYNLLETLQRCPRHMANNTTEVVS